MFRAAGRTLELPFTFDVEYAITEQFRCLRIASSRSTNIFCNKDLTERRTRDVFSMHRSYIREYYVLESLPYQNRLSNAEISCLHCVFNSK